MDVHRKRCAEIHPGIGVESDDPRLQSGMPVRSSFALRSTVPARSSYIALASFIALALFCIDPSNWSGLPTMTEPTEGVSLRDLQEKIRVMYFEKDAARGVEGTFMWLMEEVGELSSALRGNDRENLAEEFADVLAWLATIANVAGVDLSAAVAAKYGGGCPGCKRLVCTCPDDEKP